MLMKLLFLSLVLIYGSYHKMLQQTLMPQRLYSSFGIENYMNLSYQMLYTMSVLIFMTNLKKQ